MSASESLVVPPSGDTTGATDTGNINAAIASISASNQGGIIQLVNAGYFISAPIVISGNGIWLRGAGNGINGLTSKTPGGTVIHIGSDPWTPSPAGDGSRTVSGMIAVFPPSTDRNLRQPHISDLALRSPDSYSPANVDGIVYYGSTTGARMNNLSIAFTSGHGIAWYRDSLGRNSDGMWMDRVMIQNPAKHGTYRAPNDTNIHNVHVQAAGGDGFFTDATSGGNHIMVGCRADLCGGNGFRADHYGYFGDAFKLDCCSTEGNKGHGVLVTNSSGSGTDFRVPVIITGSCFEGDGRGAADTGGELAGIRVEGNNRVFISGTTIVCSRVHVAAGAPKYSLSLGRKGTGNGQPNLVEWSSGWLNYAAGQGGTAIANPGYCDNLVIGSSLTQMGGLWNTRAAVAKRYGTAVLVNGSVTVKSAWALPGSIIQVSCLTAGGTTGRLSVVSRAAGSFGIKSTSGTDTSTVVWQILG